MVEVSPSDRNDPGAKYSVLSPDRTRKPVGAVGVDTISTGIFNRKRLSGSKSGLVHDLFKTVR
jgi:hypothetical protein